MAQVKIYGLKQSLERIRTDLSEIIHHGLVEELGLPRDKKFQRFLPLDPENFLFPSDRTAAYTIIEISMFEGRSEERIKGLLKRIMEESAKRLDLHPNDLEITVFQTPKYAWGIRGKTGDELALSYKVNV
ncbi:MAG TPA: tautomerase family protein [Fibrobacteria bacterium]|nr:tautomerase family protein [Fibrobacteria bacterium]